MINKSRRNTNDMPFFNSSKNTMRPLSYRNHRTLYITQSNKTNDLTDSTQASYQTFNTLKKFQEGPPSFSNLSRNNASISKTITILPQISIKPIINETNIDKEYLYYQNICKMVKTIDKIGFKLSINMINGLTSKKPSKFTRVNILNRCIQRLILKNLGKNKGDVNSIMEQIKEKLNTKKKIIEKRFSYGGYLKKTTIKTVKLQ